MEDLHLGGFWLVQTMQNGPWQVGIEIALNPMTERWTAAGLRDGRVTQLKARGNDVITADEWLLQGTVSANRNEVRWNDGQVWQRTDRNLLQEAFRPE